MTHYHTYCANCGDEYYYQGSGHGCHRRDNNREYCPVCRIAMLDAFDTIPKKSVCKFIKTDEVDLKTILGWEKEEEKQKRKEQEKMGFFPVSKRISVALFRKGEAQCCGFVKGRDGLDGRYYHYAYWPSEKDDNKASITVSVRVRLSDQKILEYLKS